MRTLPIGNFGNLARPIRFSRRYSILPKNLNGMNAKLCEIDTRADGILLRKIRQCYKTVIICILLH